jgi:hypothetical protein
LVDLSQHIILIIIYKLNHHRLEAGGFDSRLPARLILSPNRTRPLQTSASAVAQELRALYLCHTDSDVLEVIAWKARVFRSQN